MSAHPRCRAALLAIGLVASISCPASAQDYPSRPVTVIVAFAAGGFADSFARLVAVKLSERLGQNVVIENRGGAGGNIAAAAVAHAAADGYTLLVTTTGLAVNETVSKNKGFAAADLRAIAIPAWAPESISVNPNHPARTLGELIERARGRSLDYASAGAGTSSHVAAAYFFKMLAKIDAVHVPFQGGAPAVNATIGGHVEALVGAVPGYAGQFQSGAIRGLAVASEQRLARFPDIPTYSEAGFPGFIALTWAGFFAPARTSDAIAMKLNSTINQILREPDVLTQLATFSMQARYATLPETEAYFRSEIATWAKMVGTLGLAAN
jgi:tripartite-type tricarboxylate transporter receptor subunit TctC